MCVVEIEGAAKLEPACATAVREGMKVATQTPQVAEARRNVLELLLADHPVDCPICDKAGSAGSRIITGITGFFRATCASRRRDGRSF